MEQKKHQHPGNADWCAHGKGWAIDCAECGRQAFSESGDTLLSNRAVRVRLEMLEHAVFGRAQPDETVDAVAPVERPIVVGSTWRNRGGIKFTVWEVANDRVTYGGVGSGVGNQSIVQFQQEHTHVSDPPAVAPPQQPSPPITPSCPTCGGPSEITRPAEPDNGLFGEIYGCPACKRELYLDHGQWRVLGEPSPPAVIRSGDLVVGKRYRIVETAIPDPGAQYPTFDGADASQRELNGAQGWFIRWRGPGGTYATAVEPVEDNAEPELNPDPTIIRADETANSVFHLDASRAERLAQLFHETYERLAKVAGYETRKESAVPWSKVPRQNKDLMVSVCAAILGRRDIGELIAASSLGDAEAMVARSQVDPAVVGRVLKRVDELDAIIHAAEGVVLEPGEYVIVAFSAHDTSPVHALGEHFVVTESQPAFERDEMVFVVESIDSWSWVTAVRRVDPKPASHPDDSCIACGDSAAKCRASRCCMGCNHRGIGPLPLPASEPVAPADGGKRIAKSPCSKCGGSGRRKTHSGLWEDCTECMDLQKLARAVGRKLAAPSQQPAERVEQDENDPDVDRALVGLRYEGVDDNDRTRSRVAVRRLGRRMASLRTQRDTALVTVASLQGELAEAKMAAQQSWVRRVKIDELTSELEVARGEVVFTENERDRANDECDSLREQLSARDDVIAGLMKEIAWCQSMLRLLPGETMVNINDVLASESASAGEPAEKETT